jgi:hypothetical protein
MFEEDGVTINEAEKLCRHALPMAISGNDGIWCAKSSLICYKCLNECCEDEEPVDVQGIV